MKTVIGAKHEEKKGRRNCARKNPEVDIGWHGLNTHKLTGKSQQEITMNREQTEDLADHFIRINPLTPWIDVSKLHNITH